MRATSPTTTNPSPRRPANASTNARQNRPLASGLFCRALVEAFAGRRGDGLVVVGDVARIELDERVCAFALRERLVDPRATFARAALDHIAHDAGLLQRRAKQRSERSFQ